MSKKNDIAGKFGSTAISGALQNIWPDLG